MSFTGLPIDARPYKRWAALTPSDTTVYDPPCDALLIPAHGGGVTLVLVGSDDISASFVFGGGSTLWDAALFPFSVKKVMSTGTSGATPIGLWRD